MIWDMPRVIGHNARQRRAQLNIGAVEFGEKMQEVLGKPWKRQTVSALENGDRAMIATDIAALAHVLKTTPSNLLTPPMEAKTVHVGNLIVGRELLLGLPANMEGASSETVDLLRDLMDEVREAWAAAGRAQTILNEEVADRLKSIDGRITAHVSAQVKGKSNGEGD